MNKLIEVKNIFYKYPADEEDTENKQTDVLRGVSLDVGEGEFIAILGHNGSGKSTLARMLNGLILPDNGTVLVDGMDTADDEHIFDIRSRVGLVLQAWIFLNRCVRNLGIKPKEIRRRVDEALKAVDMYEHRRSAVHKLSGGQKQRVAIAGILAMEPKCIVLDEPTAMLDPKGREEVLEAVTKLRAEQGISIVLITHYMQEATLADRIIVMDRGKILTQGTPKEVFSETELLLSHSLSVPQSSELIYKLKKAGFELPDGIVSDDECVDELVKIFNFK